MFSAMGTEPRLRIMQLLLSAHPDGLVVGEIQEELDIPNSTRSHHLDKLRTEDLVSVSRESTFLRYTANTEALEELLQFLYAECCTRNRAIGHGDPQDMKDLADKLQSPEGQKQLEKQLKDMAKDETEHCPTQKDSRRRAEGRGGRRHRQARRAEARPRAAEARRRRAEARRWAAEAR